MTTAAASSVTLPGGERVLIRPIEPADKALLHSYFQHASPESRYRRFLGIHPDLSPSELRYFTEIDHHRHEAEIAVDPRTGKGIGVGRYVVSATEPDSAEVALMIVDGWQGRGLGTVLLGILARRASAEGVRRFTATMFADNTRMLATLRTLGAPRVLSRAAGTVDYEVDVPYGMGSSTGVDSLARCPTSAAT